jgi:hypothetical protein
LKKDLNTTGDNLSRHKCKEEVKKTRRNEQDSQKNFQENDEKFVYCKFKMTVFFKQVMLYEFKRNCCTFLNCFQNAKS